MKKTERLVLFGIVAMSSPSLAGLRIDEPVVVNMAIREALGSIGSARNSADSVQFIGCSIEADSSTDPMIACFATDEIGTSVLCTSSSPKLVAAVQAITSLSFIDFQWDSDGNCTFVYVDSASFNPPRAP
jgi:hypothetical protein